MNGWQWTVFVILWGSSAVIIWLNVYGIVGSISSRKNLYFAFGLGFVFTIAGPLTFVGGAVLHIAAAGWNRHKELKEDERRNSGPKCVECGHPAGMHRAGDSCSYIGQNADTTSWYCNCKWSGVAETE